MSLIEIGLDPQVLALLQASGLPAADLREGRAVTFLALRDTSELLGCVGYELSGEVALLRSLAVQPSQRGHGLGRQLVEAAELHVRKAGGAEIFLLTTTAASFFERLGYQRTSRDEAPEFIAGSPQFLGLCPGSAVLMKRRVLIANP